MASCATRCTWVMMLGLLLLAADNFCSVHALRKRQYHIHKLYTDDSLPSSLVVTSSANTLMKINYGYCLVPSSRLTYPQNVVLVDLASKVLIGYSTLTWFTFQNISCGRVTWSASHEFTSKSTSAGEHQILLFLHRSFQRLNHLHPHLHPNFFSSSSEIYNEGTNLGKKCSLL
uniref:Xylanase inhibitor N-terminal domain-containing protein n=1 Tax=Physcomitrium patens TaxID=3218 RepID=A0A7I4AS63_PHYPA